MVLIPDPNPSLSATIGSFGGVPQNTLQSWLLAAQNALHNLILTGQPVQVSYGSGDGTKSVSYSRTTEGALRNHIRELMQLTGQGPGRRAIRVLM
jgi:hypothetical protein